MLAFHRARRGAAVALFHACRRPGNARAQRKGARGRALASDVRAGRDVIDATGTSTSRHHLSRCENWATGFWDYRCATLRLAVLQVVLVAGVSPVWRISRFVDFVEPRSSDHRPHRRHRPRRVARGQPPPAQVVSGSGSPTSSASSRPHNSPGSIVRALREGNRS
jgi:hypothetical protein